MYALFVKFKIFYPIKGVITYKAYMIFIGIHWQFNNLQLNIWLVKVNFETLTYYTIYKSIKSDNSK